MTESLNIVAIGRKVGNIGDIRPANTSLTEICFERLKQCGVDKLVLAVDEGDREQLQTDDIIQFEVEKNTPVPLILPSYKHIADRFKPDIIVYMDMRDLFLSSNHIGRCIGGVSRGDFKMAALRYPFRTKIEPFVVFNNDLFDAFICRALEYKKGFSRVIESLSKEVSCAVMEIDEQPYTDFQKKIKRQYAFLKIAEKVGPPFTCERYAKILESNPELFSELKSVKVELCDDDAAVDGYNPFKGSIEYSLDADRLIPLMNQLSFSKSPFLELGIFGAPEMHPDFEHILDLIDDRPGLRVRLSTTARHFSDQMIDRLFNSTVQQIILRMEQPVDVPAEHPAIKVLNRLTAAKAMKLRQDYDHDDSVIAASQKPFLAFEAGLTRNAAMMVSGLTKKMDYYSAARKKFGSIKPPSDIIDRGFWDYFYRNYPPLERFMIRQYSNFHGRVKVDKCMDCTPIIRGVCRRISDSLTVLPNGNVAFCSQDISAEYSPGHIENIDIMNLWLSDEYVEARSRIKPLSTFCDACDVWYQPWG